MTLIKLTRELAFAASLDQGNRVMRAAGRKQWSKSDQLAASAEFKRLWPACKHKLEPGQCDLCGSRNSLNASLSATKSTPTPARPLESLP